MVLTVFQIDKAKPADKPYKLSDGRGLALLVEPNGSKLWRFRYRFAGKENMLTLGQYPDVSLAEARDKRDEARKLLANGQDPSALRRSKKAADATAAANTFGTVVADYLAKLKNEGSAESTLSKNRWLLEDLALPLTSRPITEITPAEILALLKRIEATGRRDTARRLRGTIGSVYRFAIANLKAETDPTYALRGALLQPVVQHRAAITDERDLGALMRSIDEYDGCVCKGCHGWKHFKKSNTQQYDHLVRHVIEPERVALWEACEEDSWRPTPMRSHDWQKEAVFLKTKLRALDSTHPLAA